MAISVQNSGSITALGQTVQLDATGFSGLGIQITGTWAGTLQFEGSIDGSAFASLGAAAASGLLAAVTSATANGVFQAACPGLKIVRVRASAFASGTAVITLIVDPAAGAAGSSGGGGGGGAVTIADGADVAEGVTTDAAVVGDNAGTVSAKLRGLSKILNDVWDSVNHWLGVSVKNATLAVTQSGSWSVTANAGTNLNTSALALEAGNIATVAGIVTAARAAVNPISGQAGVQGASGVVTALTQRVVLATDIALPAGTAVIGHVIADSGSTTAVTQATAANLNATVVGTGTFVVQNNGHGKSVKTYTNTISATTSIIAAVGGKKLKVRAISLITAATTAVTVTFKDGAGGTALWTVPLQAITGTNFGSNNSVSCPDYLFGTTAGNLLEAAFSAAQSVTINVSYWDDDTT